ncbi:uncharacterized protein LOC133198359 [Saccostrea echinata]|uniref:uncharacterized protein LOC133198359 n=1 Tax=Saccostrea echinata TaxID=191078 RepID=UPI002A818977|nr:uncharacterized protein LOC133198359 [Saccostrea echinata]
MLGGFSPASVNTNNAGEVRYTSYLMRKKKTTDEKSTMQKPSLKIVKKKNPYTLKIGDNVRITEIKHHFKRDYQQKWTEEYFKVSQRYMRDGIPVYKLKDLTDDSIDGTFYQPELQKVVKSDDIAYRVEKVLKKKTERSN